MTDPGPSPPAWSDPEPARPVPLRDALRRDVLAHVPPAERGRSRLAWARTAAGIALRSSGFHVVALYRVAHTARGHGGLVGRLLAGAVFWLVRHHYGCS